MNKLILSFILLAVPLQGFSYEYDSVNLPYYSKVNNARVLVSNCGEIVISYKGHLYRVLQTEHHIWCACYDGYVPYSGENPLKIDYLEQD